MIFCLFLFSLSTNSPLVLILSLQTDPLMFLSLPATGLLSHFSLFPFFTFYFLFSLYNNWLSPSTTLCNLPFIFPFILHAPNSHQGSCLNNKPTSSSQKEKNNKFSLMLHPAVKTSEESHNYICNKEYESLSLLMSISYYFTHKYLR